MCELKVVKILEWLDCTFGYPSMTARCQLKILCSRKGFRSNLDFHKFAQSTLPMVDGHMKHQGPGEEGVMLDSVHTSTA